MCRGRAARELQTCGHYGVVPWDEPAGTVAAKGSHDNGRGKRRRPARRRSRCRAGPAAERQGPARLPHRQPGRDVAPAVHHARARGAAIDRRSGRGVRSTPMVNAGSRWPTTSPRRRTRPSASGSATPSRPPPARRWRRRSARRCCSPAWARPSRSRPEIWVKPLALALAVDTDQLATRMDEGRRMTSPPQSARQEARKPEGTAGMKLTVNRGEFLRALAYATAIVEKRNTIPVLSNVLLEASGDRAAHRLDRPQYADRPDRAGEVDGEGATTVSAQLLNSIIRELPDGSQVELSLGENRLQSRQRTFALQAADDQARSVPGDEGHENIVATFSLPPSRPG
jgi:hypothetical protein